MTTGVELYADIDEFDLGTDAIYAMVNISGKDESGDRERWEGEQAEYPRDLVPERGRYSPANFEVTVSVSPDLRGIEERVGPVESVAEFEAEVIHIDVDAPVFELYDVDNGRPVGQIRLEPHHLPDWFGAVDDSAYVKVRMKYLHEQTVDVLEERLGESEEDIERRREATQGWFEEWEEEYL